MIRLSNLTKAYGEQVIFDHVNYQFPDHGLFCLFGASGCGKSTLLHLLAGFDCDYEGSIYVDTTCITNLDSTSLCYYRSSNIGFIFQDYHLLTGYSVLENILLASLSKDVNDEENTYQKEKALQYLDKLGLLEKAHEKVEHLSGGQKQRVAIIRALMNDPSILLADEPTGSLDRNNANEIMQILKEISIDCLVLVITHDKKLCTFADECLHIKDHQLIGASSTLPCIQQTNIKQSHHTITMGKLALKNLKVHWKSFLPVAFGIAFAMLAFLLSLSFANNMETSIMDFKEKNIAFHNGYIDAVQDIHKGYSLLQDDERIDDVYYQFIISDISLRMKDHEEIMKEKYPMAKASQTMSYGTMPAKGQYEIALSPSLAKKFDANIANLLEKKIQLHYQGIEQTITICGIFNAGYDDFFLSSDVEQSLYQGMDSQNAFALNYDVSAFEDVVPVRDMLAIQQIESTTFAEEVSSFQHTFDNLSRLFMMISLFILGISMFTSIILLIKLRNTRYHEIGLLSALGFQRREITSMLFKENLLLALSSAIFTAIFVMIIYMLSLKFNLSISPAQYVISMGASIFIVFILGIVVHHKLIKIEPVKALRK